MRSLQGICVGVSFYSSRFSKARSIFMMSKAPNLMHHIQRVWPCSFQATAHRIGPAAIAMTAVLLDGTWENNSTLVLCVSRKK